MARTPDANGWYNHAVTITFQGTDATSGVDSCTQVTYTGPDDPSLAVSGLCRDRAGNESAPIQFTFKYDETPPQASATPSRGADVNGWYNHALAVTFSGTDATSGLDFCDPSRSYAGPDSLSASGHRFLPRPSGKRRHAVVRVQVRLDGAPGRRNSGAGAERERLVQRLTQRQLRR